MLTPETSNFAKQHVTSNSFVPYPYKTQQCQPSAQGRSYPCYVACDQHACKRLAPAAELHSCGAYCGSEYQGAYYCTRAGHGRKLGHLRVEPSKDTMEPNDQRYDFC